MARKAPKVNTTPTTRIINNKLVLFYSPHQIEFIVPVQHRLARSKGCPLTNLHNTNINGMKNHSAKE